MELLTLSASVILTRHYSHLARPAIVANASHESTD